MKLFNNQKLKWGLILSLILWLMFWAGYNTDPSKLFSNNFLDFIHGLRAFFPILAGFLAIIFLLRRRSFSSKIFRSPLGFLSIYTLIGIISSIFLSREPLVALYWAVSYFSVLTVLFLILTDSNSISSLSSIINLNWIIVFIITIGLFVLFLLQPGVISSSGKFSFLNERPFESLAGIPAEKEILGMVGTRPTGLGRYAGVAALVALVRLLSDKRKLKLNWFFLFVFSYFILIFSQARTAVFSFILGFFIIFLLKSGSKISIFYWSFFTLFQLVLAGLILFYIPLLYTPNLLEKVAISEPRIVISAPSTPAPAPSAPAPAPSAPAPAHSIPTPKPSSTKEMVAHLSILITLSGRTTEVWPQAMKLFLKSPLIGWGFQADRIFLAGQHAHNAILHALIQTGIIGTVPFLIAFVWAWVILFKLFKQSRDPFLIEIAGVLVFFTVRSITESTAAFFGADWLIVAPLLAYLQCLEYSSVKINQKAEYLFIENNSKQIPSVQILRNQVHMVQIPAVVELISSWIEKEPKKCHWIVVTGMHGIVEAHRNPAFKNILKSADLFVPDGISLVWIANYKGFSIKKRVSGTDLMQEYFKIASKKGYSNFFYGDTKETLKVLEKKLSFDFPELKIVGFYSPPFRSLAPEEDKEIIEKINQAKPDVLWVALGLPKQEQWVFEHKDKLHVPVIIGVGAAFKFLSGKIKRAPIWAGDYGLEWLWRLFQEPGRIWRRVLLDGPLFIWLNFLEFLGVRHEKD